MTPAHEPVHEPAHEPVRAARTAHEVLAALTPAERIAMLHQHAPRVERLGLEKFHTGTEALHGLSWLGEATVFPQPGGLAASWDPALLERVGAAVATEVRAKHAAQPEVSLNVWAPVVNIQRHPLWGRNEEGYSEDPDLTADLATAYCRGLRGDDPVVWKTVPTLKHFLGYGNEDDRAATSSHLPPQALREVELPAFTGPLRSGTVGAVMPSYNLVNGRPSHVSGELLAELRTWAPGSVVVLSDAYAPTNLVEGQRYFADHAEATAAAVHAGVDSFTDADDRSHVILERLERALEAGLLTQDDVDRAALRLLELRERTGELAGVDPYGVGPEAIDTPEHRALAREAAGRGVVLLANDGVLPLAEPAVLAVVGPFADHVVHDWYSSTPPYTVSLADALRERYPAAQVRVASGADVVALYSPSAGQYLAVSPDADVVLAAAAGPGATATLAARFEVTEWGGDLVTLRSQASGRLLTGASWIIAANADRVGGWVAQETFRREARPGGTAFQHVGSGKWLRVQRGTGLLVADGPAHTAEVFAVETLVSGHAAVAQACEGADVALVAVGNDPHVHGRETEDRPELVLPAPVRALWRTAAGACPRAVLTIVSSYPYTVAEEAAGAAAVVWSSHGGQELGHGLVDVLAGDRTPTGRLAQTWWADERDAGDLFEYDVVGAGMTYRYADAEPLYPLGHGLGYAPVVYEAIAVDTRALAAPAPTVRHVAATYQTGDGEPASPDASAADADRVTVTVTVRNAGDREADELVAVYVRAGDLPVRAPRARLAAWTRVRLAAGERREVRLAVAPGLLAVWDVAAEAPDGEHASVSTPGAFVVQPGTYVLASGPSAGVPAVRASVEVSGLSAPPRAVAHLPAAAFHRARHLVTGDRTRASGGCLEVAAGHERGTATYRGLDLDGVRGLELEVAHRRTPGWRAAAVTVRVRPAGSALPWRVVAGPVAVPTDGGDAAGAAGATGAAAEAPYAWRTVPVDLDLDEARSGSGAAGDSGGSDDAAVDLQVDLEGAARLASVRFVR